MISKNGQQSSSSICIKIAFTSFFILITVCNAPSVWGEEFIKDPGTPFALVELFTSQGCSSSPPADDVLRRLTQKAETQNKQIYTLSFHVDYWNYLGWTDPYSSNIFTERQRRYAQTLGSSVYTPQMIINGSHEFVGSREKQAVQLIDATLNQSHPGRINLFVENNLPGQINVRYRTEGLPLGTIINIALAESGVENYVPRGENSGRTLKHDHVVKSFYQQILSEKNEGAVSLKIPEGLNYLRSAIIVFAQDPADLTVIAANAVELKSAR